MKRFLLIAAAVVTVLLVAFPGSAQVAAPADTVVSFQGVFDTWVVPTLSGALAALAAFLGKLIKDVIGRYIGASNAEALEKAIGRGLQWALDQLAEQLDQRDILEVDVKHAAVASAMMYVTKFNPDMLKFFGLDVDQKSLRTRVEAQLAELLGVEYHVANGLEPLTGAPAVAPPAPPPPPGIAVPQP